MVQNNSENPRIGREFQNLAMKILQDHFKQEFEMDKPIPIGNPPKHHKFDCVSLNNQIVVECKSYSWTLSGNIPSAKMAMLNEALFYMSYLPKDIKKIIVMKKATHPGKKETLAEYCFRIKSHLLDDVSILEIDEESSEIKILQADSL